MVAGSMADGELFSAQPSAFSITLPDGQGGRRFAPINASCPLGGCKMDATGIGTAAGIVDVVALFLGLGLALAGLMLRA